MGNPLRQWCKIFAVFRLAAYRYGKQRAAVESVYTGDNLVFVAAKTVACVFTCQFQRRFIGFRAGIAEKYFVGKAVLHQSFRQGLRRFGGVNIGNMPKFAGLLGKRLHQFGMTMAERIHGNAPRQIQIFTAFGIPYTAALPFGRDNGGEREIGGQIIVHQEVPLLWHVAAYY